MKKLQLRYSSAGRFIIVDGYDNFVGLVLTVASKHIIIQNDQKREILKETVRRVNCHDDLVAACQAGVLAINEMLKSIQEVCKIANISMFPPPPIEGIKQAIINAGGEVYETAEQATAALANVKKER